MWQQLDKLVSDFLNLELDKVVDFEKFNRIAIVHHSSAIEGSTLTLEESTVLITEGITAKGKPLSEHQMVKDHFNAILFCIEQAKKKTSVTLDFLKNINALVNKSTGQVRNLPLGVCDDTKGDFRLGNVSAGTTYFVNYDKVVELTQQLCLEIQNKINDVKTNEEIYKLAFDAHFNLVSIHPWFDGNGRTSRLLMNYVLAFHAKPLTIVYAENKPDYIMALNEAREKKDIELFRSFMCSQQVKFLETEILKYQKRNDGFKFMF